MQPRYLPLILLAACASAPRASSAPPAPVDDDEPVASEPAAPAQKTTPLYIDASVADGYRVDRLEEVLMVKPRDDDALLYLAVEILGSVDDHKGTNCKLAANIWTDLFKRMSPSNQLTTDGDGSLPNRPGCFITGAARFDGGQQIFSGFLVEVDGHLVSAACVVRDEQQLPRCAELLASTRDESKVSTVGGGPPPPPPPPPRRSGAGGKPKPSELVLDDAVARAYNVSDSGVLMATGPKLIFVASPVPADPPSLPRCAAATQFWIAFFEGMKHPFELTSDHDEQTAGGCLASGPIRLDGGAGLGMTALFTTGGRQATAMCAYERAEQAAECRALIAATHFRAP